MSPALDAALRNTVFIAFVLASAVALTHWAVRQGHLSAFGVWPRLVRRLTDPILRPIENRLHRAGQNPQDAPVWLAGIVLVGGLLLLALLRPLVGAIVRMPELRHEGPAAWLAAAIHLAVWVLKVALIVRVIASWLGFEFNRWLRPFVTLTEWMLRPLRRVLPRVGIFDISPFVAYLLLIIGEHLLQSLLR